MNCSASLTVSRDPTDLILYKDDAILVVNKPAGIPVHAGSGGGQTLEDFFPQLQLDAKAPPHLAHRLDRDTSGCLILGRTKQALRQLGRLFEQGRIHKVYWALVHGVPEKKQGRIDFPLAKKTQEKHRWHMQVDSEGQEAITDYQVLGTYEEWAWLALRPKTGRTHQLRVHCAAMGCPIIGDRVYGTGAEENNPLMLHARRLTIPLYPDQPALVIEAPPPAGMAMQLEKAGLLTQ